MASLIQYEFNVRRSKGFATPWITHRFYDEQTATLQRNAFKERDDVIVSDMTARETTRPYVIVHPTQNQAVDVNTTGLVFAGEKIRHYATGSTFERWYCREEDLDAVRRVMNGQH